MTRSASDNSPSKGLLSLTEFRQRRSVSSVQDDTLAERMSRSRPLSPPRPLALRMSSEQPSSLKIRIPRFKPIAESQSTSTPSASSSSPPPAGGSPAVSSTTQPPPAEDIPNSKSETMPAPEPESDVSIVSEVPETSFEVSEDTLPTTPPESIAHTSSIVKGPYPILPDLTTADNDDQNAEPSFGIIKHMRLGEVTTMKEQGEEPSMSTDFLEPQPSTIAWGKTPQRSISPNGSPIEQLASLEDFPSVVEVSSSPQVDDTGSQNKSNVHTSATPTTDVPKFGQAEDSNGPADAQGPDGESEISSYDDLWASSASPANIPRLLADSGPGVAGNTSDVVRRLVADMVMDVEQQVEAVLQANHSVSSPVHSSPPPVPDDPAPVRPGGVFGLFSFGLTHPLSFFVTEGTESGIARMITVSVRDVLS